MKFYLQIVLILSVLAAMYYVADYDEKPRYYPAEPETTAIFNNYMDVGL